MTQKTVSRIAFIVGYASVLLGLGMIYPPLVPLVGGAFLLFASYVIDTCNDERSEG